MRGLSSVLLGLSVFLIIGCGSGDKAGLSKPSVPRTIDPSPPREPLKTARQILSHRLDDEIPLSTRAFLIAGSRTVANFAQEIITQKQIWLNAGLTEDQIACYYSIPSEERFRGDYEQFVSLASELSKCYPASPDRIWRDLERIGKEDPDFLYLYVTSHGSQPIPKILESGNLSLPQALSLAKLLFAFPELDQFLMAADSLIDGSSVEFDKRFQKMYENPKHRSDYLFTPRYLKQALSHFPSSTPKYITIQGCFSGGFVHADEEVYKKDALTDLQNLSLLTASRHDRSSFGCQPGVQQTYFGTVYNETLKTYSQHPRSIPWRLLAEDVENGVTELEKQLKMEPPSLPQYYLNFEG